MRVGSPEGRGDDYRVALRVETPKRRGPRKKKGVRIRYVEEVRRTSGVGRRSKEYGWDQ